ncbi:stage V sporulation protein AA [Paenibacillus sp. IB182496]|uniref:Stage V sporulation protein AA n=1 Tax=Paenibacillus sabuli TaxID=2772509 RepID=A0A927BWA4_9BACL|nr:stage V sporulation protein AA [Paenibacillus sabuli]MBD2846820.1 stage V sporulation protein AA [Paenibacillus sabuli]
MEKNETPVLYLRLRKRLAIRPGQTVRLGQAAALAAEPQLQRRLADLIVYAHRPEDGNRYVIDLLHIVRRIHELRPGLQIEPYGEPQVLVTIAERPRRPLVPMLIFAWLLLFFGAGLAIMNFHEDVSMKEVHVRISELVTGQPQAHPLWFQIPYSFGLGAGMLLFFNHLLRKRFNDEPNPLEVEMYMYQENVNAYVIADEMRKKQGDEDA